MADGAPRSSLWRHREFTKLWAGQTVSQFGSQVTFLALPLTAALTLDASAAQMGILSALETAPFLIVGLFAGVWVDRRRRRPLLIAGDLGRAVVLLAIPAADLLGFLRMDVLFVVAALTGLCTLFFDVAYQSYLPALVEREHLVEGNSKLEVSRSAAQIAGPGLAGALVQILTAPLAILADAVSFLVSAGFLLSIRAPEPAPAPPSAHRNLWREIAEGLRAVFGNPNLRAIAACTASLNISSSLMFAVFVLYATRNLHIKAGLLGVIFAAGNVGFLLGALLAGRLAGRFGVGPAIIAGALVSALGSLLVPLAGGQKLVVIAVLIAAQAVIGFGGTVYNITQVSLRQTITPDRLQGRMNATMRFIVWGVIPLGALAGGALGDAIGLRPTLVVGALTGLVAFLWVLASPLRALHEQPAPVEEEPATA